jgi:hypothetical protein
MPISSADGAPDLVTSRTWMRCFSRFVVSGTISGGPWIKMAMYWISWCSAAATRRPRRNSSGSCSKGASTYPMCSLRIGSRATVRLSTRCCPVWNIGNTAISTTARRIHTNPPANESGACRGSSHRVTPSAFSRLSLRCIATHRGRNPCVYRAELVKRLEIHRYMTCGRRVDSTGIVPYSRRYVPTNDPTATPTRSRRDLLPARRK